MSIILGFIFDPRYFLIVGPAILLALWAQLKVKSAYAEASQQMSRSGLTGAQAAARILERHGLMDVGIELARGFLGDHYDPRSRVLRLSPDVYHGRSLSAVGIAAHEAGHALQHAQGYAPLALRNNIVPLASVGSNLSMGLLILGFILGGAASVLGFWMLITAIVMFSTVVLFQIVNLPVEFNASRRAKAALLSDGIIMQHEELAVNKVLSAAALTYVAATLTAILQLVYFIVRSGLLGGRRN